MKKLFFPRQYLILVFLIFFSVLATAQPPTISYESVISGLTAPLDIVNAGDGTNRLFIVEQGGKIKIWNGGTISEFADLGTTGANIITTTGGEEGLLSMAFHPEYNGTTNRYFFVYYTDLSSNISITRYQTMVGDPGTADLSTALPIITIPHPGQTNHNGGKLNFGSDGYLYFATGDGGGGNDPNNNAQNGTSLLGKMIRIDINSTSVLYGNYAVPADNPYVTDDAIDDRIWALGLRNPFRWSFDRSNGDMWIGDVGQGEKEEVNFRPANSTGNVNYGWRCFEGYISTPGVADCTPADYQPPVFDYDNPSSGSSSVVGGYVYRGSEFTTFRGYYIAADVYSGTIYLLWPNGSGGFDSSEQTGLQNFVVGFGEAENGTLYASSQATGIVYKVVAAGGTPLPVTLEKFSVQAFEGFNQLQWVTSFEQNTARFGIEYSNSNQLFQRIGTVAAKRSSNGGDYAYRHLINTNEVGFYRLAIEDDNGETSFSFIVKVAPNGNTIKIYPTVIKNSLLTIELPGPSKKLQVVNSTGSILFETNIASGTTNIVLPMLAKGLYVVRIIGNEVLKTQRIVIQ